MMVVVGAALRWMLVSTQRRSGMQFSCANSFAWSVFTAFHLPAAFACENRRRVNNVSARARGCRMGGCIEVAWVRSSAAYPTDHGKANVRVVRKLVEPEPQHVGDLLRAEHHGCASRGAENGGAADDDVAVAVALVPATEAECRVPGRRLDELGRRGGGECHNEEGAQHQSN